MCIISEMWTFRWILNIGIDLQSIQCRLSPSSYSISFTEQKECIAHNYDWIVCVCIFITNTLHSTFISEIQYQLSALLIETFSFWRWTNFQSRLKLQFTYSHVLYHLADRQTAEDISFSYNWKCVLTHWIRCESDLLRLVSCVYVRHRRKKTHCK